MQEKRPIETINHELKRETAYKTIQIADPNSNNSTGCRQTAGNCFEMREQQDAAHLLNHNPQEQNVLERRSAEADAQIQIILGY